MLGWCKAEKRDHTTNDFREVKTGRYRGAWACVYCKELAKKHG